MPVKIEEKDMYGNVIQDSTKKVVWKMRGGNGNMGRTGEGRKGKVKDEEVEENRRSRSGILRIGVRQNPVDVD